MKRKAISRVRASDQLDAKKPPIVSTDTQEPPGDGSDDSVWMAVSDTDEMRNTVLDSKRI